MVPAQTTSLSLSLCSKSASCFQSLKRVCNPLLSYPAITGSNEMGQFLDKLEGKRAIEQTLNGMVPGGSQGSKYLFQRGIFDLLAPQKLLKSVLSKEWRKVQVRSIIDGVFNRLKNDSGRATLTFEDLYIAVLLVYNDVNKNLPGPHFDPPSKHEVRDMMEAYDINLDGQLDCEEFAGFIEHFTERTLITVSQGLILTLAVAPTLAILTKKFTEGVPGVGKVVQKLPNSVYASLVTLAIVLFRKYHLAY
ncbi:Acetyl-CoA carboxylase [Bertholletia excelsa]